MADLFSLWIPTPLAETSKEVQLLDRALGIIAMQRNDLSVRSDLFSNPYALSSFHRWMQNPIKAPMEVQNMAVNLLQKAEDPSLWFQELLKLGDLDSADAISLKKYTRQQTKVPKQLREAIDLLLDSIYTANQELAEVMNGVSPTKRMLIEEYLYPTSCDGKDSEGKMEEIRQTEKLREALDAAGTLDGKRISEAGLTVIKSLQKAREILTDAGKWQEEVRSFSFMTDLGLVEIGGTASDVHQKQAVLVIDLGGDDLYKGNVASGINAKSSLVLDLDGNDAYLGENCTQASGIWGIGVLFDLEGDDLYKAGNLSQGAGLFGLGLLIDAEGSDSYLGTEFVQAASSWGWGGLIDLEGEDTYQCQLKGQAYSGVLGISSLCDLEGNDKYISGTKAPDHRETDMNQSLSQGFAFGKRNLAAGGFALLADREGNDLYQCQYFGQGASYWMGVGILYDDDGKDTYVARRYAQGAGIHFSFGSLIDAGGDDHTFSWGVSQGCGHDYGIGILLDETGDDTHVADWLSMGASEANGIGIFIDNSGDDGYDTNSAMAVGGLSESRRAGGLGLFIDAGGKDRYSTKGSDNSVWGNNRWSLGIDEDNGGISGINLMSPKPTPTVSEEAEQKRQEEIAYLTKKLARAEKLDSPLNIEAMLAVASHWGLEKEVPKEAQEMILGMNPEKSVPVTVGLLDTPNIISLIFMKRFFEIHAFQATPELIKKTRGSDPLSKARALYYLGLLGDSKALEACVDSLGDPSWRVRSAAISALGEILNRNRLETLIPMKEALGKASKENNPEFIKTYLKEGGDMLEVLSVLARATPFEYKTYVRYAEMNSGEDKDSLHEDYSDFIFDHLNATLPLLVRWVRDLERADEFGKTLMVYGKDPDPAVRKATAYSLAQINYQPAIPQLLTLLKDPDKWVRDASVLSLSLFGDKALPSLVLAMKQETSTFRILALHTLAQIKSDRSRAIIGKYLDDPNKNVRRAAKRAFDTF
jgi:hypothetical protein